MKVSIFCFFCLGLLVASVPAEAKKPKKSGDESLAPRVGVATRSPEEHYRLGTNALGARKWQEAARQFHIVALNFPNASYGQDALFFLGIAHYHLSEFDLSNETFDKYLQCQTNPKYFKEAFEYKFNIAEKFRGGERRRFFGVKAMPRLASGKGQALTIYDEVIASLPSDEIAAKSLFGKACILWEQKEYRDAVEAFQTVSKRYPKHELAPESYLLINRVYIDQCQHEFQNPDLLLQ